MRGIWLFSFALVASGGASARAEELLRLLYHERPPYQSLVANEVRGITADPATAALRSAGVPFVWVEVPAARQVATIQSGRDLSCLVGWYKTPERVRYARFTRQIYKARPTAALGRADDARLARITGIDALLSDPNLLLLVKSAYSYGDFLDDKIAQLKPRKYETTVENNLMFLQIARRRGDYMFVAAEEGELALRTMPEAADLAMYPIPDMPEASPRHIMCSMAVPQSLIERIDAVIPSATKLKPSGAAS